MELTPFNPARNIESNLYLLEKDDQRYLIKSYIDADPEKRCHHEQTRLTHWRQHGFPVPCLYNFTEIPIKPPFLIMDFIEGDTLQAILASDRLTPRKKLAQLHKVFMLNAARHHTATSQNDALLVHSDPNLDNIIVSKNGPFFLDFEHISSSNKPLRQAIAQEVSTFSRRAATLWGKKHLRTIIQIMHHAYQEQPQVLEDIIRDAQGRSFSTLRYLKRRLISPSSVSR